MGSPIDDMLAKQREIDEKLSPSKYEMRYITDYARVIYDKAQLVNNASEMAHQGLIDFELAQKIMDTQKENIKSDIKYLQIYLGIDEKDN
ncbi:hypothetical protein [Bacillus gaemokensis]|uniref:Uncharacterized protein n=1 Tax=Bacillus gaemokensis TaxID=574375 RepID=A0A073KNK1_9BACI|nr:hypothetical protein [Bacillus gaemokensis]KEK23923.1 hypothetical protein BAGA_05735 [Bacillus gaemokensis]KYG38046.1 hypothetical protein AZF08_20000 [Bacillus gaemokensis]